MKKLIAPQLPDNPTPEEKEAFRQSVTESMNRFMEFAPAERNQFLDAVLRQLVANGMRPIHEALPEGITTEPISQRFMKVIEKKTNRKISMSKPK